MDNDAWGLIFLAGVLLLIVLFVIGLGAVRRAHPCDVCAGSTDDVEHNRTEERRQWCLVNCPDHPDTPGTFAGGFP